MNWTILGGILVIAAAVAGCDSQPNGSSTPCPIGSVGCPCTSGNACDPGLSCRSNLCVDLSTTETDNGSRGGSSSTTAGALETGGVAANGGASGSGDFATNGAVSASGGVAVSGGTPNSSSSGVTPNGAGATSTGPGQAVTCPSDMVRVPDAMACIDAYEASRSDATAASEGAATGPAQSKAGAKPWYNVSWDQATAACTAAGKRLCTAIEWQGACRGSPAHTYPYGDTYDSRACLTSDTPRDSTKSLPYETGALPQCQGGVDGLHDMAGNVAEWTSDAGPEGTRVIKGSKYNTAQAESACDYAENKLASVQGVSLGFRCCSDVRSGTGGATGTGGTTGTGGATGTGSGGTGPISSNPSACSGSTCTEDWCDELRTYCQWAVESRYFQGSSASWTCDQCVSEFRNSANDPGSRCAYCPTEYRCWYNCMMQYKGDGNAEVQRCSTANCRNLCC